MVKVKKPLWSKYELDSLFDCMLPEDFSATGISIDTRTIKPGDIFIAITGEMHDGHRFVKLAEEKGASAVIVSRPVEVLSCPVITVDDTLNAMRILGRSARLRSNAQVIAITGSVGKTSTKEMLRQALAPFGKVAWAEASYNNHWGVPLTLSRLPTDVDFAIFEIGMNNIGEIAPLSEMVRPNIAIITAIAPAHIGNMGNVQTIAEEKSDIFVGLEPDGIIILPSDPEFFSFFKSKAMKTFPQSILSFGEDKGADVRLFGFAQENGEVGVSKIAIGEQRLTVKCPLQGRHMAINGLVSFAVGKALRLDLNKIAAVFEKMSPIKKRCQVHQITLDGKNITLIDDSFNANLSSMMAGLDIFMSITPPDKGRRVAVLGEMLELGGYAINHHQQVSHFCTTRDIDKVFLCGGEALKQGFVALPDTKKAACVDTCKELIPLVRQSLKHNDVVFVKGSKGSKVSLIVEDLLSASDK